MTIRGAVALMAEEYRNCPAARWAAPRCGPGEIDALAPGRMLGERARPNGSPKIRAPDCRAEDARMMAGCSAPPPRPPIAGP